MEVQKRERNVVVRVEKANGLVIRLNNNTYINGMGKNMKRDKYE